MPEIETDGLLQKAVLWPALAVFDDYGESQVGAAEEISVRWITKRHEGVNPKGNPIALDALVIVSKKIDPGSRMWLGTLADFLGTGSGGTNTEVMEVATYKETPDVDNRNVRRKLGLRKFRDDGS